MQGPNELHLNWTMEQEPIAVGFTGKVYKAVNKHDDKVRAAIKYINKNCYSPDVQAEIYDEIAAMQTMDHPHIVSYLETYDDANHFYIVMQYCEGG
jgi:serine/threonine protein kinase